MMDIDGQNDTGLNRPTSASASFAITAAPIPVTPAFDAAKYRANIESLCLTADQERELLETLWSIMYSFVELGFKVDVYSALIDRPEIVADDASAVVDSLNSTFSESSNSLAEEGPS